MMMSREGDGLWLRYLYTTAILEAVEGLARRTRVARVSTNGVLARDGRLGERYAGFEIRRGGRG
jgi:hypothetical protein